jgi:hypothetical protein
VLSAHDPSPGSVDGPGGDPVGDWLDTEGRQFGIVVLRFLHSRQPPELPTVRRVTTGGGPS